MNLILTLLMSVFVLAKSYTYVEELDLQKYQGAWYEVYDGKGKLFSAPNVKS